MSYVPALRFQFFVPIRYNPDALGNQADVPQAKFDLLDERLVEEFPGLTNSLSRPPTGQGLWLNDSGSVVGDVCYLYDIVAEVGLEAQHRTFFVELLREFMREPTQGNLGLGQEAALLILTHIERLYLEQDTSGNK